MLRKIRLRSGKEITVRVLDVRAMLVWRLHEAARDGLIRDDLDPGRVYSLGWLVWNDGTSWIKRAVFAQLLRLIIDGCDIFVSTNKKQTTRLTHPSAVQLSVDCPETKVAYEGFGFVLGLALQRLKEPIDVFRKDGTLLCRVAAELEANTGDNHAHQGMMGHNMAGEHTCVIHHHPKSEWLGIVATLNGDRKTYTGVMKQLEGREEAIVYERHPVRLATRRIDGPGPT